MGKKQQQLAIQEPFRGSKARHTRWLVLSEFGKGGLMNEHGGLCVACGIVINLKKHAVSKCLMHTHALPSSVLQVLICYRLVEAQSAKLCLLLFNGPPR